MTLIVRAGGGQHPMIAGLGMALIALARGRRGRGARKAEGREQARGAEIVEARDRRFPSAYHGPPAQPA